MITDRIIEAIGFLITLPLRLLPQGVNIPVQIEQALSFVITEAQRWNILFPVIDVVLVLGLILTLEASILGFRSINWVINKVRGSGG